MVRVATAVERKAEPGIYSGSIYISPSIQEQHHQDHHQAQSHGVEAPARRQSCQCIIGTCIQQRSRHLPVLKSACCEMRDPTVRPYRHQPFIKKI
jgi:hypothetical protein